MERIAYRIIDANFNRAREACRVIEEFCRFVLNNQILTERIKKIRHELSAVISSFDSGFLLAGRDTKSDVGAGKKISGQMHRDSLADCFTAACKRLSEALRVLAEVLQTIDSSKAMEMENLRFSAYEMEKDVVLFYNAAEKFKKVKLYIIVTSDLPAEVIHLTQSCIKGGTDCIQLRVKKLDTDAFFALACEFVKICRENNVISIINDRADIAVASDADGVHIGLNDLPIEQVRKLQKKPLLIGCTTHSIDELQEAVKKTPTYVSLGPVFATVTKPNMQPVGLEYVRQGIEFLKDTGVHHVAIGGINTENLRDVLNAGAKTIAVCSAVTQANEPTATCRQFKKILHKA